jgi:hypothetical protein
MMAEPVSANFSEIDEATLMEASKVNPSGDYMLLYYVKPSSVVHKSEDVRDTKRQGLVILVGPGVYDHGVFIPTTTKSGEFIIFEEAGSANTPKDLENKGLLLVKESRKMATLDRDPNPKVDTKKEIK